MYTHNKGGNIPSLMYRHVHMYMHSLCSYACMHLLNMQVISYVGICMSVSNSVSDSVSEKVRQQVSMSV